MTKTSNIILAAFVAFCLPAFQAGCAEEGKEGVEALDCGAHGTEHDGHCHCDGGYLFDGATCVTPEHITAVCEEEAAAEKTGEGTDVVDGDAVVPEEEHEHAHTACLCPAAGDCPCDHGTVESFDGEDYCVPNLHKE